MPKRAKQNHSSKTNENSRNLEAASPNLPKETDTTTDQPSEEQGSARVVATASSFIGPIPPPEALAAYDQILPGCADRILKMAENEQKVSNEVDLKFAKYVGRGQIFGFILGLVTIVGGILLIYVGKDVGGLTSLLSGLGALFWAYLHGQKEQKDKDKEE
ncbi:MAG: DUF2335 domain-containing protein [bacterium]